MTSVQHFDILTVLQGGEDVKGKAQQIVLIVLLKVRPRQLKFPLMAQPGGAGSAKLRLTAKLCILTIYSSKA
jgi:hypothetical protein